MKKIHIDWSAYKQVANVFVGQWFKWFALGTIVLIMVLGWFVLLQREYNTLRNSGIIGYQATIERLQERQTYLQSLREMERSYNELNQEQLRQMEQILPVGFDATTAMARVEEFARQAGLELLSVDVSSGGEVTAEGEEAASTAAPANSNLRVAQISLNLTAEDGSYEELKRFLDTIDSFVPVMNLAAISYAPATTSYAIQLETYYIEADE